MEIFKNYMVKIVRSIFAFLILTSVSVKSLAQNLEVSFNGPLNSKTNRRYTINEFLEKNIKNEAMDKCKIPGFGFFYFKLNSDKKIKNIIFQGTLTRKYEKKIVKNIKASAKYWDIPLIQSKDGIWIIYPYFNMGSPSFESGYCSEAQDIIRTHWFILVDEINSKTLEWSKEKYFIILNPSKIAGFYIDV
jgi:hypothetical protein